MGIETTSSQGVISKVRVLVVDDDVKILRFIGASLRLNGYDVTTITRGEEALKLAGSGKADIIVLDILMPVMDGFEVLRKLRSVSELPVIVISANVSAAEKALSLGANDFLAKPFLPDELIKRIGALKEHKG
jgi:two-component system, OmpR family, KDP operon response regulator KdpE